MKLDHVEIKNFRSLKDIIIDFNPLCRVLVGINESGKSNILKALALLGSEAKPNRKDDLREALPDENPIDESYVRFVFKFGKNESDKLIELVIGKIASNVKNPDIVSYNGKKQSIKEFCASKNEGLYVVNILEEHKSIKYWKFGSSYSLVAGWKKPTNVCPPDFVVEIDGKKNPLSQYKLIRNADFPDIPESYLEDATIDDLTTLAGNSITEITQNNLPDTLFWEYHEVNLLPNVIKIADFSTNPDSCVPLKNMFILAGIENIKTSLDEASKGTDNQFQNYLDRIAKKTTNHFRDVWKEYKEIEFSLKLNAEQIVPGVKEKNTHDFARRSDGFKRFVTFLLLISVKVKTDNLRDTLLIIDEPDISLHPSGTRYLRDELIRISKKNYVVYSTHSIFMIDSGDISRHYIVKKKNEITNIVSAMASNIADEEVLYNALGYSIFSILKEKNIIFEGWNDKRLFQIALENASKQLKEKFKKVGICHAKGVKTIKSVASMIELANRECLILSDSDKPAKEQQRIYQQEKGFGKWKNYQNVDSSVEAITGEDFIKNDFIIKTIQAVLSGKTMPVFDASILPIKSNKLSMILKWLTDNGMTASQARDTIEQIKNSIFDDLKHQNIEDDYTKLLQGLLQ